MNKLTRLPRFRAFDAVRVNRPGSAGDGDEGFIYSLEAVADGRQDFRYGIYFADNSIGDCDEQYLEPITQESIHVGAAIVAGDVQTLELEPAAVGGTFKIAGTILPADPELLRELNEQAAPLCPHPAYVSPAQISGVRAIVAGDAGAARLVSRYLALELLANAAEPVSEWLAGRYSNGAVEPERSRLFQARYAALKLYTAPPEWPAPTAEGTTAGEVPPIPVRKLPFRFDAAGADTSDGEPDPAATAADLGKLAGALERIAGAAAEGQMRRLDYSEVEFVASTAAAFLRELAGDIPLASSSSG